MCSSDLLCALRYGAIPVVAKVGGLADTVTDVDDNARDPNGATGIHISQVTRDALEFALRRVSHLWSDKKRWKKVQLNGMRTDVSWKTPAAHYARLYADLTAAKK
mgnify:FL=1